MINTSVLDGISENEIDSWILDLSENSQILQELSHELLKWVVWQQWAKSVLENILEEVISDVNIKKEGYNKPIASMIFAGPSWVWKTLLARVTQKILNKHYSNDLDLIKINCADFAWETAYSLSRLVWATAWYIGSDKKPQFHPDNVAWKWRVILFDEIEKAWTPFWNLLLSILDDGTLDVNYTKPKHNNFATSSVLPEKLTYELDTKDDNSCLRTFFNDSIIIMTSNLWNDRINNEISGRWIWFNPVMTKLEDIDTEEIILEEFWKQFKIEMQWRFDHVVPFNHLTNSDAELIIGQIIKRLITETISKTNWFLIEFTDDAKSIILEHVLSSPDFRKFWWRYIENYFKKNIIPYVARAKNSWLFSGEEKNNCLLIAQKQKKIIFSKVPIIDYSETKDEVDQILHNLSE